jgi:signal transduction histidine kinase
LHRDTSFPRLVTLACHDLRTPLATVNGFARTLERTTELAPPADRYVEMIVAAVDQLAELLDELSLASRIEAERYEPNLADVDLLELAHGAAARLGEERVRVSGEGAAVRVDRDPTERGVAALVQAALRHGGLDEVALRVRGIALDVEPVTANAAQVVLASELRDLGAAVAVRLIETIGGSLAVEGERLTIELPAAEGLEPLP